MRRWAALVLAAVMALALLTGCGQEDEGFTLNAAVAGTVTTSDPAEAVGLANETVVLHLYENLMRYNAAGELVGGAAKSYDEEVNFDGTVTYTFRLRSGARWSDGRDVKAQDFVYAWQRLVDPAENHPNHDALAMVQGYDAVRAGGELSELAVSAKNDATLIVTLAYKCPYFLTNICTAAATMPVRSDKAVGGWTGLVTNGPYQIASADLESALALTENERYHERRSSDPASIVFRLVETTEDVWALYESGEVDFAAPVPAERLAEKQQREYYTMPRDLGVCTVLFNNDNEILADPEVRRALNLVIDRQALAELAGPGAEAAQGLVSGVSEGEESFRDVGGDLLAAAAEEYADNCALAAKKLAGAGYPGGEDFPAVEYLYVNEGTNAQIARAVCAMWREKLGITVAPKAVTAEELETALAAKEYVIAAVVLTSPVDDAMGFLDRWETGNEHNCVAYTNSAFDTLMAVVRGASDEAARTACLHDAETLLLEDAALAPLYAMGSDGELRAGYGGAWRDGTGHWYLGGVTEQSAS